MQNADVKDGNQATTPFSYFPCTEFLPVRPHCVNAILVWHPCTVAKDYPAGPEI